jgi:hypothetical protein
MRKKRLLLISLQLAVVAGFVLMALASSSGQAAVKSPDIKRMNRGGCNSAELVFLGVLESQSQCAQSCRNAGFSDFCLTGSNCFCK